GFLISPAMNVTLFQASLENKEPTIADTIAAKSAAPLILTNISPLKSHVLGVQASVQFKFHISDLKAVINPRIVNPPKESILTMVSTVCKILPFFTPLVLSHVS